MTARTKSTLLLLSTLLIGMLLGVFVHTLMVENRIERLTSLRSQAGFVKFMDKMIEPTNDAQRNAIRDVLEQTAERLDVHHAESRETVEEIMESFRASLDSLLTEEQIDALNERMERMRHYRKDRGRRDSSSMHRGRKDSSSIGHGRKDSSSMNHGRKGAYSERSKGGSDRYEKSPEN
ncbi:MAG: hypothetical protein F4Y00_10405 [Bacteroidetes bacterium SB0662_bin_6]|nr:hypothetical protein [Bacteroidetes bacterium SB0668_bin_1]MYE05366.1 hypothetical protein [Bacteroidetes bacterium SB0662_bin_6]